MSLHDLSFFASHFLALIEEVSQQSVDPDPNNSIHKVSKVNTHNITFSG